MLIKHAIARRVSAFRDADRTWVEVINLPAFFCYRNMSMAVNQDIASGQRREIIRAKKMTMGEEQTAFFQQHLLPRGGHGEVQQHLIHFAVAVTAHGDN